MKKLISIDMSSDCGFFKNPQFNGEKDDKNYGFDSIHKLSIFGMCGSMLGLSGIRSRIKADTFEESEYYEKLKHIKIGISILSDIKKEWIVNNSHSGMFNSGGNLIIRYDTLISPKYRIYFILDTTNEYEKKLYDILSNNFIGHFGTIHFGKSNHIVERTNFKEYSYILADNKFEGFIKTLFDGSYKLYSSRFDKNKNKYDISFLYENKNATKTYERNVSLPVSLKKDRNKFKYDSYVDFIHTNKKIITEGIELFILDNTENEAIYLF